MPDEKDKNASQPQPGWLDRLRQRYAVPPDPPPPPPPNVSPWRPEFLRTGAMDSSKIGQIGVTNKKTGRTVPRDVTLGEIPNILFNEYRSVRGSAPPQRSRPTRLSQPTKQTPSKIDYAGDEDLRKAKTDTAYAIFNDARYAPRTKVALPVVSQRARQSPEYARDFKDYQNTVWDAFAGYMMGQDRVEGRGRYNFRPYGPDATRLVKDRNGKFKPDPQQTIYRHYGPFYDPNQSKKNNPAQNSWLTIYNPPLNPAYAPPKKPKGQK